MKPLDAAPAEQMVAVPRELVDRLLDSPLLDNTLFRSELRDCIKPRRWEFERFAPLNTLDAGIFAPFSMTDQPGFERVRVTIEEIL